MNPLTWIRQAGAPSEDSTDRDGAFSYHAETHAAGVGMGIAWLALVTGDLQLLSVVVPVITSGLHARRREFGRILEDVYKEPHYALGGMVFGGVLALPWTALPL